MSGVSGACASVGVSQRGARGPVEGHGGPRGGRSALGKNDRKSLSSLLQALFYFKDLYLFI